MCEADTGVPSGALYNRPSSLESVRQVSIIVTNVQDSMRTVLVPLHLG